MFKTSFNLTLKQVDIYSQVSDLIISRILIIENLVLIFHKDFATVNTCQWNSMFALYFSDSFVSSSLVTYNLQSTFSRSGFLYSNGMTYRKEESVLFSLSVYRDDSTEQIKPECFRSFKTKNPLDHPTESKKSGMRTLLSMQICPGFLVLKQQEDLGK